MPEVELKKKWQNHDNFEYAAWWKTGAVTVTILICFFHIGVIFTFNSGTTIPDDF